MSRHRRLGGLELATKRLSAAGSLTNDPLLPESLQIAD
jgi:hypothetical protein